MAENRILIVDFGGQYNQLIARRVRECGVYSEIKGFESIDLDWVRGFGPKGIIFTGGPQSAYGENAPSIDDGIFELGVPILGICYGAQLMAYRLGGKIESAPTSEYGRTEVVVDGKEGILVASKIADRVGITRSVIVNALRKFESAGIIESRSSGMKGTYIKVLNDYIFEELEEIKMRREKK